MLGANPANLCESFFIEIKQFLIPHVLLQWTGGVLFGGQTMCGSVRSTDALRAVHSLFDFKRADFSTLGANPPRHLLLSGPPGVGKTHAVTSVAAHYDIPIHVVHPGVNAYGRLSAAFKAAINKPIEPSEQQAVPKRQPPAAIVFIDELDAVCPAPAEHASSKTSPTVSLLASFLDDTYISHDDERSVDLFVVAATNRPSGVHPALLRTGGFHRHIMLKAPTVSERVDLLCALLPDASIDTLKTVSHRTSGFVAADLSTLCRDARSLCAECCKHKNLNSNEESRNRDHAAGAPCSQHILDSIRNVIPSALRTSLAPRLANTPWDAVAGVVEVKRRLQMAVEWPLVHARTFQKLGLSTPRGILLHGPPGCSKTTLVRAAATAAQAPFLRLTAADVYSSYVGDSERILRDAFAAARAAAPCILFLDEIDAVASKRQLGGSDGSGGVQHRVLSTLLTEMDGVSSANGVLVVAATNRLDMLDDALLRPGRFDDVLHVGLPDVQTRADILDMYSQSMPLGDDVDIATLVEKSRGWSGADLKALCTEAALIAMREVHDLDQDSDEIQVRMHHFSSALQQHTQNKGNQSSEYSALLPISTAIE